MKRSFWQQHGAKVRLILGLGLGIYLSVGVGLTHLSFPAIAQAYRPEDVAEQVYQRLPELSPENQYLSRDGEIDSDNSLISRLIRYHLYVKNRPFQYRLDWQLTIADYFGINEPITAQQYPGSNTLQTNPLEGDRRVITSLTLPQRRQLVDTIMGIYNPNYDPNPQPISLPQNTNDSTPVYRPQKPQLPQPGDAELLLP